MSIDETLFFAINHGMAGPVSDWLMVKVTEPSTWYLPLAVLCVGLLAADRKRGLVAILAAMVAVGAGDALAHNVIKPLAGRARPCAALENVHLLVGCTSSFSFPSNHAVNSMALAGAIGWTFRPLMWGLIPVGVLVCLSRVAVGVHYPSDVVAGGILGFIMGAGVAAIVAEAFRRVEGR